jgi:glyoxylase I family protein
MTIEHIAINVADPAAFAAWYGRHCGLRIVRHTPERAQTHFLADDKSTVIEVYCNPADQVPDYAAMDPLIFHLAVQSTEASADATRLEVAGATRVSDTRLEDGSHLVMMRDPWGIPLQICQRVFPLHV